MSDIQTIQLEVVLAAIIDDCDGVLVLPSELLTKDRAGKAIAINYDGKTDSVVFTLVDNEDIDYDDEG